MTITTKENANGRISGYYVDGQKVRKNEIEPLACNTNEIVEIDYYTAKNFPLIEMPNANMKVVFTGYYGGRKLMTKAAAEQLGATIGRGHHRNVYYVDANAKEINEADIDDYAVTVDAQDSAIDAEIQNANANENGDNGKFRVTACNFDGTFSADRIVDGLENAIAELKELEANLGDTLAESKIERQLHGYDNVVIYINKPEENTIAVATDDTNDIAKYQAEFDAASIDKKTNVSIMNCGGDTYGSYTRQRQMGRSIHDVYEQHTIDDVHENN